MNETNVSNIVCMVMFVCFVTCCTHSCETNMKVECYKSTSKEECLK